VFVIPSDRQYQQDAGGDSQGQDDNLPESSADPRPITSGAQVGSVAWDPVTGGLLIAGNWEDEYSSLRRYSLVGNPMEELKHSVIFGEKSGYTRLAVSPSGRTIVYVRQKLAGDVWLLKSVEQPY
jgi:hypothetical protein